MHTPRFRILMAASLALAVLVAPIASAETAWKETFTTGTGNWSLEWGSSPSTDSTTGNAAPSLKIPTSGSWSIRRGVGWAAGCSALTSIDFLVSSTSGQSGFRVTMDYTAPDTYSTGSSWVAVNSDGSNTVSFGDDWGAYTFVGHYSGQTFQPAANKWYRLTLQMDGTCFPASSPQFNIWLDEWDSTLQQYNYLDYADWQYTPYQVWRVDRVHIMGETTGSARNVYVDNVETWDLEQITAPDAPEGFTARMGPDPCPSAGGAFCSLLPYTDGIDANDIELTWWTPDDGNAPIDYYRITRQSSGGGSLSFNVPPSGGNDNRHVDRDLPTGIYTYTIVAHNYKGDSLPGGPTQGWSTGVNQGIPGAAVPAVRTSAQDYATFHFGSGGTTATLVAPGGQSMSVTFAQFGTVAGVAVVGFDGTILSAREAGGGPMSTSAFRVTCEPRLDFRPCLAGVGADGTWQLTPALNDAARPAGSVLHIQGLTYDDWASGTETGGTGHDSMYSGGFVRHWNWHQQQAQNQPVYEACAALCHLQGPPQESAEYTRVHL